ncbi:hypothetical protein V491_08388, partial [Pseudogymnoascus sp. VKM F-3775]
MVSIESSSNVQFLALSTKASVNMVTVDGSSAALDKDNRNNFCAAIAVFESAVSSSPGSPPTTNSPSSLSPSSTSSSPLSSSETTTAPFPLTTITTTSSVPSQLTTTTAVNTAVETTSSVPTSVEVPPSPTTTSSGDLPEATVPGVVPGFT